MKIPELLGFLPFPMNTFFERLEAEMRKMEMEARMDRAWIGEVRSRCVKTVVVMASSRKEAEMKLRNSAEFSCDIEGIDVAYYPTGSGRIIREDKKIGGQG